MKETAEILTNFDAKIRLKRHSHSGRQRTTTCSTARWRASSCVAARHRSNRIHVFQWEHSHRDR